MMKVTKTTLDGLLLIEPKVHTDARGSFYESWREKDYQEVGIQERFVQDNFSISKKNVLRGMHYQSNQGQLVTVVSGIIYDVVVDIRKESKTYKKFYAISLDGDKPQQLYMPPGFAHGFCVLSEIAVINYKCTQYYDPSCEGGLMWNDPEIGIPWPIENPIISSKDLQYEKKD